MSKNYPTKKLSKHERYFFDIPVFRCALDKWSLEQEDKKRKLAQNIAGVGKKITEKEWSFSESWLQPEFSSYRYSEMVGMIRLYAMNQQIKGELFFVKQRISKNLKKKNWIYIGKLFEFLIFDTYTNQIIFKKILERLEEENKTDLLKNRYIDLGAFYNSGSYIDYVDLVNF